MKVSAPAVSVLAIVVLSMLTGCSSKHSPTTTAAPLLPTSAAAPSSDTAGSTSGAGSAASISPPSATSSRASSSASPTRTHPSGAPTAGLPTCRTQQLSLAQGRADGTAGSFYVTYYLSNRGPGTCSTVGFPGFSYLFADGSIIQRPANRTAQAPLTVTLQPGQRASFVVRTLDGSIPGTGCSTSWKTAEVQVYPPDQTVPLRQPSSIAACDLTVGPVAAG
jgi:hypothetical protein